MKKKMELCKDHTGDLHTPPQSIDYPTGEGGGGTRREKGRVKKNKGDGRKEK